MLSTLILTAAVAGPPIHAPLPPATAPYSDHEDDIRAAGDDVEALLELAERYRAADDAEGARKAWTRVLELDEDNGDAHRGLGHKEYDGRWFETYAELSAVRREEDRRMLEEHGKVRFGDGWVLVEELPFRRMGYVEVEGRWLHPAEAEELEREAELAAQGWQSQDGTWVPPDEFDRWKAGLWKVGDEWVEKEAANAHHAELDSMWEIAGEHFVARTTCDRDAASWVPWWADRTYSDLVRIFGVKPARKPRVVCVRSIDQYNVLAGGDPATGRAPAEGNGWSSVHYAFLADAWFDASVTPPRWRGCGACYYDVDDPALKPYGQHAVRHAAGQSFVEALDPSWDHVSRVATGATTFSSAEFWAEKELPLWLRYGACSYVERYFRDPDAEENPWWPRDWALDNVRAGGGLLPLEQVLDFRLDPNDPETSGRLIQQAGLLVSFVLDGECKPVIDAHRAFKAALRAGEGLDEAREDLEESLTTNEKRLRRYAGV